ncbi:hypothetical protein KEM48_002201 [Puccinia striiformis f. sp. tritici PST-130]|nr:hypothetical protein KEM48_002201 [Puccinia striiformis f. sp. tritici PST-130]
MRGQGMAQRDGTFRSLPVNVTLAHPYRFDILPGRSYALSGHISKLDDGRTTIMQVNYDGNHRPLPGGEQVELGPMMITGNGKITRVRYINSMNVENPTLKLVVSHDPAVSLISTTVYKQFRTDKLHVGKWRRASEG